MSDVSDDVISVSMFAAVGEEIAVIDFRAPPAAAPTCLADVSCLRYQRDTVPSIIKLKRDRFGLII